MEKTKKVPVCGGGGKINKHNGWLLLSIKASLSLQAQSVVSMLATPPCFIQPWTVCFDGLVCTAGALWSSTSTEGRQSTYGRVNGVLPRKHIPFRVFLLSIPLQSFLKRTSFSSGAAVPATAAFLKEYLRCLMILKVGCPEWSPIFLFVGLFLPCMPIWICLCKEKRVLHG